MIDRATTNAITRVQIARYAGAVGDFNPMHLDDEFAQAAGLPSVIAHGPLTLTLVIDALVAQLGVAQLRSFDARLRAPVFPGDALEIVSIDDGLEVRNSSGGVVALVQLETTDGGSAQ
ncbi:MAG: MaoC/PaaZ C-terminal domain-containing protein [Ilumatobacteraceae bacterium]|nr:MaoC/PaaZ C-terminal domain-containing protein [Ilumatobacteraceae bacterium]